MITFIELFDGRKLLGSIPVRVRRTVVGDVLPGKNYAPAIPAGSHALALSRSPLGYYVVSFDGMEFRVAEDNLELLTH